LQDDETAIIASSAADVRGSDCRGGLRPTSFGDAFFTNAVRRSDDLVHAFEVARRTLAEHRAAEPIMSIGPAIAERLKTLRSKGAGRVVAKAVASSQAPSPGERGYRPTTMARDR
ncbi:MAG TPA: hypothetical protein VF059_03080, partial [Casimicrobiaceae bacterium]